MASSRQLWFDSTNNKKKDETEELLVFGYSCKLFRDDDKALYIDQGKHLIPWMGDESLKIDRYDVRGTVYDLRPLEPLPGGATEAVWSSLSDAERRVEHLCDEERYRALHHNEAEEALYQEEELKRLHKALDPQNSYGQVAYSYDNEGGGEGENAEEKNSLAGSEQTEEEDEPFVAPPELDIPVGMMLPEKTKLNAIMEKTALFISTQGPQMEILLKMKQAKNPQFSFLSFDCPLHSYYRHLLMAIKTGRYRPKHQQEQEQQQKDQEGESSEHYLHPSLAAAASRVELAPSIPSIPSISYKPSADCAYSMLVNKIKDKQLKSSDGNSGSSSPQPGNLQSVQDSRQSRHRNRTGSEDSRASGATRSSSLSSSCSDSCTSSDSPSHSPSSSCSRISVAYPGKPSVVIPPGEIQLIVDKMASYVIKNGRDFESVVRSKGDDRFAFLDVGHKFHPYYEHKMRVYQGLEAPISAAPVPPAVKKSAAKKRKKKKVRSPEKKKRPILLPGYEYSDNSSDSDGGTDGSQNGESGVKPKLAPVCFSIKKPKEAEILKEVRSALPLEEESSDGEEESQIASDAGAVVRTAPIATTAPTGAKNTTSVKVSDISAEDEMERLKQLLREKERQLKEQEKQQKLADKRRQDIFQIDDSEKRVQVPEVLTTSIPVPKTENLLVNEKERILEVVSGVAGKLERRLDDEEMVSDMTVIQDECTEVVMEENPTLTADKNLTVVNEENPGEHLPVAKEENPAEGDGNQSLKNKQIKEIEEEVIAEAEIIDLTDEKDDIPRITDCKLRLERKMKAAAFLNRIKKEHPLQKSGCHGSDSESSSKHSSSPPPSFHTKSDATLSTFNGASVPRTSLMARLAASTVARRQPSTPADDKKNRKDKIRPYVENESPSKISKDRERSRNTVGRHRRKKKKHGSSSERDRSHSRSHSRSVSRSPLHRHREDSDLDRHSYKHRKEDRHRSDHRRKHEMVEEYEGPGGHSRHHKRHKEIRHINPYGHTKRLRESKVSFSDSNSSD